MSSDASIFRHAADFAAAAPSGGLGLGVLESQYEELFAEVLEDGVITEDERARLTQAAKNLGLDPARLDRLEEAMTAAYETHHRVRIEDRSRARAQSLTPLAPPERGAQGADASALALENQRLRERIAELEAALLVAQNAVNVEVDLGDLESHAAAATDDPIELWKQVRRDPLSAGAYRALRDCYQAKGDADGAYCAIQALVAIGQASPSDRAFFEQHRTTGLIQARTSFDAATWDDCLFHPEEDRVTGAIFSVVAPAVLIGRVTTLRRDGKLKLPAPDKRQDPAQSTLMAARAVGWAATLMGLPCPGVFIEKDRDFAYAANAAVPPHTWIGKQALSGRSPSELAFLVGRHLCGYRGEHFVRTLFPATEDLEDLFLAALLIANPALPIAGVAKARVEPLARAIQPLLEPLHIDALRGHYLRFAEEGGRTNLQRWGAAVEKTAHRVGLALSQDLSSALGLVRSGDAWDSVSLDLLAFSTSDRFLLLRRRLGLSLSRE
jgi:hypothetical protein